MTYRFGTEARCGQCGRWDDVLAVFPPVLIEVCLPCASEIKRQLEGASR